MLCSPARSGQRLNLCKIKFQSLRLRPPGDSDIVKWYVILCAVALGGCATFHVEPTNQPLSTVGSNLAGNDPGLSGDEGDLFVGLAFSGGGMRAAAFSYGVLAELDRTLIRSKNSTTRLIDHVDFLSGVSGGAITAAYFGLNGRSALSDFRERFFDARRRGIPLKHLQSDKCRARI